MKPKHRVRPGTVAIAALLLAALGIFVQRLGLDIGLDADSARKLDMLYQSWIIDGKPENYDVWRYYLKGDDTVKHTKDTNQYALNRRMVTALFRANYNASGEDRIFILARTGEIFRQQGVFLRQACQKK